MISITNLISDACKVAFGHDGKHDNDTNAPTPTYSKTHVEAGLMHMAKIYESTPKIQTAHHNVFRELEIKDTLDYDDIQDLVIKILDYMDAHNIQLPEDRISNNYRAELTTNTIISGIEKNSFDQLLMDSLRFGNLSDTDAKPYFGAPRIVVDNTNPPENS
ncbi:MAG: hypothetical protein COB36_01995 [Alphaproteobacteria bacterium]|nr:MAG: hypothetical protein COB36_01995 [Alphaproteobacteria bacterium]